MIDDKWLLKNKFKYNLEGKQMFPSPKKKRGITLSHHRTNSSPHSSKFMQQSLVRVVDKRFQRVDSERINQYRQPSSKHFTWNKPKITFSYKSRSINLNGVDNSKSLNKSNQNKTAGTYNQFLPQNTMSYISSFRIDLPKQSLNFQHRQEIQYNRQQTNTYQNKILLKNLPLHSTPANTYKAQQDQVFSYNTLQTQQYYINYARIPYAQVINQRKKRLQIRREVNLSSSPLETTKKNIVEKQVQKNQLSFQSQHLDFQVKNKQALSKYNRRDSLCSLLKMESKLQNIIQICDSHIK